MNSSLDTLHFLIPGDLETRTGGYLYDKRIAQGLRVLGKQVDIVSLPGDYPDPDASSLASAEQVLADLPDGALTLIDGLAFAVLPSQLARHAHRLRLLALVHHPLALETGITQQQARGFRLSETQALSHAHRVIVTSETTARSLQDYGVNAEDLFIVCPGTDAAELSAGSDDEQFKLLCVATLTQRKGHAVLLDALARLRRLPWSLVCAGSLERDRATAQALSEQVKKLELQERVHFVGEVGQNELDQLYHEADLFVLASYHEGYGMVLDEAIARALPVVATRGGAMAQTVPPGAGLLSAPGDTEALAANLRRFMQEPATRASLQEEARKARSRLRSWQQAAGEFNEILSW